MMWRIHCNFAGHVTKLPCSYADPLKGPEVQLDAIGVRKLP